MNDVLRSTRAELLRLRKWPALWVVVGTWLVLNFTFAYAFPYLAYRSGEPNAVGEGVPPEALLADVLPAAVPDAVIQGMPMFGGALMTVLGALVVGSGFGWGTWKTVLVQGPRRGVALLGTLAALGVVVVSTVAVTFVLDTGLALGVAALESADVVWAPLSETAEALGAGLLVMGMWTLLGVMVGTVARGPALAVGLGLVWSLVVENLLRGVASLLGPVEALTEVLPGTAAGSLVGALGTASGAEGTPGVLTVLDGGQSVWLLAAWAAVAVLVSLVLVQRRDVI
ncbi:MAG TPA: hypothetical protein VFD41_13845 [Actinomycetales bacterium]|nr:hypothetical protein [Actinomycetales bacterium]